MRLIDADELIEEMRKWYWDKEKQKTAEDDNSPMDLFTNLAILTVKEQLTSYDVGKVVQQLYSLKKYSNPYDSYYEEASYRATEYENSVANKVVDDVIKIVKAGGIDE